MKKYWKQIVGAIILVLVLILIGKATHNEKATHSENGGQVSESKNVLHGEVSAEFEGKNTFKYKLVMLDGATTTLSMDNRLLTIKNATGSPIHIYFSYEGGRGYSAKDYINNTIASKVALVKREEMTHGTNTWSVARSANSSWHVGKFGEWLVVIENVNADKDIATKYIESFASEGISDKVAAEANVEAKAKAVDADTKPTSSTSTHEMY